MDIEQLLAKLREVESSRPNVFGDSTNWYRNPEGPQAADEIEKLREALRQVRRLSEDYDFMGKNDGASRWADGLRQIGKVASQALTEGEQDV